VIQRILLRIVFISGGLFWAALYAFGLFVFFSVWASSKPVRLGDLWLPILTLPV